MICALCSAHLVRDICPDERDGVRPILLLFWILDRDQTRLQLRVYEAMHGMDIEWNVPYFYEI